MAMAQARFDSPRPERLNERRVKEVVTKDNPDYDRMMVIAQGMEVDLPSGVYPNGSVPDGCPKRKTSRLI